MGDPDRRERSNAENFGVDVITGDIVKRSTSTSVE
jgi:hypothetical protein